MKEISRIFDILTQYEEKYPEQKVALAIKRDGEWQKWSPAEYAHQTELLSYALIELGIAPGDKVGIISSNRPEWNILDMAIMQVGGITVPVYPTISPQDYQYILQHSEMKMVVMEGTEVMHKISSILSQVPNLQHVYTFQNREQFPYWVQLMALGEAHPHPEELARRREAVKETDCATIIYTSGTTGIPKGVMLSHYNIVHQSLNLRHTPAKWSKTAFSFLPLCHAYERTIVFLYQHLGMSVYYAQNLGAIAENIKEVNPTMMSAVPRVLEKFYDKIWNAHKTMKPLEKAVFRWAVGVAKEYHNEAEDRTAWYNFKHFIADRLVYSKIRKKIGGHFDVIISGAASLQPRLAAFFSAISMPVYEGYGATETSPVIATSCKERYGRVAGTVGFPLPGIEVRISEQGEILCKGHNVMMGYYKDEAQTKKVIDAEGWFHTGDLGHLTDKGQLVITGRVKNLFKTSLGKYINPQVIEEKFCESPFIENMVVVGENQKFAAALISPDFEFLEGWCQRHGVAYANPLEATRSSDILKRFAHEVDTYNQYFGETEKIRKFKLVPEPWTQQNHLLTPTLKVKRYLVQQQYADLIEALYR